MPISLIIVDDHHLVRKALVSYLSKESFCVLADTDKPDTAVQLIGKYNPDVVLQDICLPYESCGIDCISKTLSTYPKVKILAISGNMDPSLIKMAFQKGAIGYFSKTGSIQELRNAVSQVNSRKRYLCPISSKSISDYYLDIEKKVTNTKGIILTSREKEVMSLLCEGKTTKEIAFDLNIGVRTVSYHRQSVMRKLNVDSLAALIQYSMDHGF